MAPGKETSSLLRSSGTELLELVELYMRDCHEVEGTLGKSLCRGNRISQDTELFNSIKLYSGDNVEIVGHFRQCSSSR